MTRLIDADALKKDKFTTKIANGVELEDIEVVPVPSIDNAPTVEVPENEVNCVLTMFGECSYNKTGCSDCEIKDKIRKALSEKENLEKKIEFLMQQIRLWQSTEQQEGDCEHDEERPKDNDLCKTCKKGEDCELSTKIFSICRTTRCYKYEEADNE